MNKEKLINANTVTDAKFISCDSEYSRGWNDALDAIIENAPTIEKSKTTTRKNIGKYRGRRLDNNEWVYGWYVGYSEAMGYIHGDYVDKNEVWEVDAQTVGEYTYLTDKSGKEIYEGDFVKDDCGRIWEVVRDSYRFALKDFYNAFFDSPDDGFSEDVNRLEVITQEAKC